MSSSEFEESFETHTEQLSKLFVTGTKILNEMLQKNEPLTFDAWSTRLSETDQVENSPGTYAHRTWLWDAIRTEPSFKTRFGELPRAPGPWTNKSQRFRVFNAGEQFEIRLKGATASVTIEKPLEMKPGKGGRLECCNCKAIVAMQVGNSTVGDESYFLRGHRRIDPSKIKVSNGTLTVEVKSLNQVYSISSRRLEPARANYGGSIYEHMFHVKGPNRTLLEDIRRAVEAGKWNTPPPHNS